MLSSMRHVTETHNIRKFERNGGWANAASQTRHGRPSILFYDRRVLGVLNVLGACQDCADVRSTTLGRSLYQTAIYLGVGLVANACVGISTHRADRVVVCPLRDKKSSCRNRGLLLVYLV